MSREPTKPVRNLPVAGVRGRDFAQNRLLDYLENSYGRLEAFTEHFRIPAGGRSEKLAVGEYWDVRWVCRQRQRHGGAKGHYHPAVVAKRVTTTHRPDVSNGVTHLRHTNGRSATEIACVLSIR